MFLTLLAFSLHVYMNYSNSALMDYVQLEGLAFFSVISYFQNNFMKYVYLLLTERQIMSKPRMKQKFSGTKPKLIIDIFRTSIQ